MSEHWISYLIMAAYMIFILAVGISMKGKNKDYIFDRLENGSSKEFMRNGYTALPISH